MSTLSPLAQAIARQVATPLRDTTALIVAILDNQEFTEAELLAIHVASLYTGRHGVTVRCAVIRAHSRLAVEGKTAK